MIESSQLSGLAALRRFVARPAPQERCELCAATLGPEHPHLLEAESARVVCACTACALLFPQGDRYRLIPREVQLLPALHIDDVLWRSLGVPIELAYFFRNSATQSWNAVYPSPAGPMQSPIDEEDWREFAVGDTSLLGLRPDVEAFLVNRLQGARRYFIAPIDECHRLTGIVRKSWRGFSGGDEAWAKIAEFFDGLERRSASHGGTRA